LVTDSVMIRFVQFYLRHAPALVKEVGYVPLPAEAYRLAYQRFLQGVQGSLFTERSTVGADIVQLLQQTLTDTLQYENKRKNH
ncbi:MAG TPA: hypothetical protein VGE06_09280, partial [Flavisolibacter sp.]